MSEYVARLEVAGLSAATITSPFFLKAAADLVLDKLPLSTMLEVYHKDEGLVARIGLTNGP